MGFLIYGIFNVGFFIHGLCSGSFSMFRGRGAGGGRGRAGAGGYVAFEYCW